MPLVFAPSRVGVGGEITYAFHLPNLQLALPVTVEADSRSSQSHPTPPAGILIITRRYVLDRMILCFKCFNIT